MSRGRMLRMLLLMVRLRLVSVRHLVMLIAGPGLVFVVFPHALSQMPYPQVWSVIFFGLVICLGIDSQFATVEVIITSVKDGWQDLNK